MDTILVTAIGSFAADIVIKNLQKEKYRIVGCDIYPKEWIVDAYTVERFYQVPRAIDKNAYIDYILYICQEECVKYIVPLTDVEVDLYNEARDIFEKRNICVCISCDKTIRLVRNKKKLEEYLRLNANIYTIPTEYVNNAKKNELQFPIICKPDNGRSSLGFKIIQNEQEWNHYCENCQIENYIVQPFIRGDIVTVDVLRNDSSNTIVAVARKELLRTANGAGTSVYVYSDNELISTCKTIAHILNIKGCVNFEFILDEDGVYHFLECNPRFSGGVEFSCIAGYDFVKNHLLCFQKGMVKSCGEIRNMYVARKYEEYVTCIENIE